MIRVATSRGPSPLDAAPSGQRDATGASGGEQPRRRQRRHRDLVALTPSDPEVPRARTRPEQPHVRHEREHASATPASASHHRSPRWIRFQVSCSPSSFGSTKYRNAATDTTNSDRGDQPTPREPDPRHLAGVIAASRCGRRWKRDLLLDRLVLGHARRCPASAVPRARRPAAARAARRAGRPPGWPRSAPRRRSGRPGSARPGTPAPGRARPRTPSRRRPRPAPPRESRCAPISDVAKCSDGIAARGFPPRTS